MRLRLSLALLLVAALVAIVVGPADAKKKKKATVSKELRIAGVKIEPDAKCKVLGKNKRVKTWNMVYDPCHLLSVTAMTCIFADDNGRTAYDAIWDSRKVLGYDCGSSQYKYKGNRWESVCGSVANTTSIDDLYVNKVKCTKKTQTNKKKSKKNKKKEEARKKREEARKKAAAEAKKKVAEAKRKAAEAKKKAGKALKPKDSEEDR
ncbi:hypothetical protein HK405_007323 [Cladochytrium tenue]|nr:hypothetical protein HK405_007323 [Cladochytrium tenue]